MSAKGPAPSSDRERWSRWARRIIGSRYFFAAVLIHLVLFGLLGAWVVFRAPSPKGSFTSGERGLVKPLHDVLPSRPIAPAKSPEIDVKPGKPTVMPETPPVSGKLPKDLITGPGPGPLPPRAPGPIEFPPERPFTPKGDGPRDWQPVIEYQKRGIRDPSGKPGMTITAAGPIARFSCYVIRYSGGDWDCNFGRSDGTRWYGNCIYNLMLQVSRWTLGRVNAELLPVPLTLSDPEWLEKVCPPFVFMTGHKDFRLTADEVENLRQYLMLGGALWVDNALPGRRSRFDVALRRELKRVLPDREFVALGSEHPLFRAHFRLEGPPSGMNGYREPVEAILIGGKVAVLYTLNAYSDLWETGLDERDQVDLRVDWSPKLQQHFSRTGPHWSGGAGEGTFFRNVNRETIVRAYQLGINTVIHLLTRFEDKKREARGVDEPRW